MGKRTDELRVAVNGSNVTPFYVSNGVICPSFGSANNPKFKRLKNLFTAKCDIEFAKQAFEKCIDMGNYQDEEDSMINTAYPFWCTGTILYCRWFGAHRGENSFDLTNEILKDLSESARDAHKFLDSFRNEFFAHHGRSPYQDTIVGTALSPKGRKRKVLNVFYLRIATGKISDAVFRSFISLCDEAIALVSKAIQKAENKLMAELGRTDLEILYRAAAVSKVRIESSELKWRQDYTE